jgi:hypothetical protein
MRKSKDKNNEYYRNYYATHKEEHKSYQRKCKPRTHIPDSLQESRLRYLYKWTVEQYNEQLALQDGHCALCPALQGDAKRRMAVDHDHTCCKGKRACEKCRRGILCANCNRKLGFLEQLLNEATSVVPKWDTWLENAILYLRKYSG